MEPWEPWRASGECEDAVGHKDDQSLNPRLWKWPLALSIIKISSVYVKIHSNFKMTSFFFFEVIYYDWTRIAKYRMVQACT